MKLFRALAVAYALAGGAFAWLAQQAVSAGDAPAAGLLAGVALACAGYAWFFLTVRN